jgi:hypothetical protein
MRHPWELYLSPWRFDFNIRKFQVPQGAFIGAAKALKRQITPEMLRRFERWTYEYGVSTLA